MVNAGGFLLLRWGGRLFYVHRWLLGFPPGEVHHKNGDRHDVRRANLEAVPAWLHRLMQPRSRDRAWPLGVTRRDRRWAGRVQVRGRTLYSPRLDAPLLAAMARDDLVDRATGGRGWRNFPGRIRPCHLRARLRATRGEPFEVYFVKRSDGQGRHLRGRTALPLEEATHPARASDGPERLLCVIDLETNEYRYVPLEGVLCVRLQGIWHRLDRPRPASIAPGTCAALAAAGPSSPPASGS